MITPERQLLTPLSRPLVTVLYVLELAFFTYCVVGAANGRLVLPGKAHFIVLSGWPAWLACVFPLSFLALFAVRCDPAVKLSDSVKRTLMFVFFTISMAAMLVAVFASAKR